MEMVALQPQGFGHLSSRPKGGELSSKTGFHCIGESASEKAFECLEGVSHECTLANSERIRGRGIVD